MYNSKLKYIEALLKSVALSVFNQLSFQSRLRFQVMDLLSDASDICFTNTLILSVSADQWSGSDKVSHSTQSCDL